jgi:RHS repeat-associated protein
MASSLPSRSHSRAVLSQEAVSAGGRSYDPRLGRFLSADPLVAAPHNLQTLNRYSYAINNPLSVIDPTGLAHIESQPPIVEEPDPEIKVRAKRTEGCEGALLCGHYDRSIGLHDAGLSRSVHPYLISMPRGESLRTLVMENVPVVSPIVDFDKDFQGSRCSSRGPVHRCYALRGDECI